MSIYFDNRWCGAHGIGRFATELAARLPVVTAELSHSPTSPFDFIYLTYKIFSCEKGLWFSPGFNAPISGLDRYIFVIHDLNHVDTNSSFLRLLYYRQIIKPACNKAARILTVSEFSRNRIIDWSGANPDKVINVGNGVSEIFSITRAAFLPGFRYLLCVGNRKPHKNEVRLVQAFARAEIDPSIHLVFNGSPNMALLAAAKSVGVSERLVFLGGLSEKQLAEVYRGAECLVFPSLYEGFGFPIVEAMASGIPVLTSNVTSLPEVAGEAALLVDPYDIDSIAQGITRIINDDELRSKLMSAGLVRAKNFTWEAVASRVANVLNAVQNERVGL